MLGRLTVVAIWLTLALATSAEAKSDAQDFWSRFRQAVLSGKSDRVAAMTKLPLWVRGPDDSDPVVYYGRQDFDRVLKRLLNQEVTILKDGKISSTTMLKVIREKRDLSSKDLQTPNSLSVELFYFEKIAGRWIFTRGYLEEVSE